MAITPLPTPPTSSDPTTFNSRADAFLAALVAFVTETNAEITNINDLVAALPAAATNGTSSSSVAIGTGDKTFTTQTGKMWVPGMFLLIASTASPANYMYGQVKSYSDTTLIVTVLSTGGSGTIASWTISASIITAPVGSNRVRLKAGNGHGSTNTMIRRMTTVIEQIGTAITYADSATLGGSFTINESGIYSYSYIDGSTASAVIGLSVNSTELTTQIASIAEANRVAMVQAGTGILNMLSGAVRLAAGDVLRMHTNALGTFNSANATSNFSLTLIQRS